MQLLFNVPPEADGVLLRGFLRRCAVSTELARAVKFHGSGFFADDVPILANRRVQAGQTIRFALPADGPGVEPQPEIPVRVVYRTEDVIMYLSYEDRSLILLLPLSYVLHQQGRKRSLMLQELFSYRYGTVTYRVSYSQQ